MKTKIETETLETTGFVSRWSRRKIQHSTPNLEESNNDENATELEAEFETELDAEKQRLEKLNALTDEDMPDIDTLDEHSDYSGFMSKNVSEALRKMALQKLFHGESYNIRDGLDEYDGDYTSFTTLDENIVTCDMKHLLAVEAEKLLLAENDTVDIDTEITADANDVADANAANANEEAKSVGETAINKNKIETEETGKNA